jgi:hypothetical protein
MRRRSVKVTETPEVEIFAEEDFDRGKNYRALARNSYSNRATFALKCVERWAMVAAEADGEDSAGRAKLRRMTPGELTQQACDTSAALFDEFEKRGWVIEYPSHEKIEDFLRDAEDRN